MTSSLSHPHHVWAVGSSYAISKSIILGRMVSGRSKTEMLSRFWSSNNRGYCLAPTCHEVQGDLQHLLVVCPALEPSRHRLHGLWCRKSKLLVPLHHLIIRKLGSSHEELTRFILDCMSCPELIQLVQLYGSTVLDLVLYLTRTWVYSMHRQKQIIIGRWPSITNKATEDKNNSDKNQPGSDHSNPNLFCVSGPGTDIPAETTTMPALLGPGLSCPAQGSASQLHAVTDHDHAAHLAVPPQPVLPTPAEGHPADHGSGSYMTTYTPPLVWATRASNDNLFNQDQGINFYYDHINVKKPILAETEWYNWHHSVPDGHGWVDHGVPGVGGVPCREGGSGGGSYWYQPALHSPNSQSSQMSTAQPGHRGSRCGSVGSTSSLYSSSSMLLPCSVVKGTE